MPDCIWLHIQDLYQFESNPHSVNDHNPHSVNDYKQKECRRKLCYFKKCNVSTKGDQPIFEKNPLFQLITAPPFNEPF